MLHKKCMSGFLLYRKLCYLWTQIFKIVGWRDSSKNVAGLKDIISFYQRISLSPVFNFNNFLHIFLLCTRLSSDLRDFFYSQDIHQYTRFLSSAAAFNYLSNFHLSTNLYVNCVLLFCTAIDFKFDISR